MGFLKDTLKSSLRAWSATQLGPGFDGKVSAITRAQNEYGVDPFGFSLEYALAAMAPFIWVYRRYHRVTTHGIGKVPRGRVLLVANHSGQLPMDGAMIGVAMLTEGEPPRAMRAMVEKWVGSLPWVSTFMARVGQIVGTPENCRRLLENDEAILVFPEGIKGISKLWPQRYQLQEFGLGFMRLALETNSPIVPVAVIGAEEQAPAFFDFKSLGKLLGMPALPVTATGVPFPLPTKYHLHFGDPLFFTGRADDDDGELEKKVKVVKAAIQTMLDQGLKQRQHVFW